MRKLVLFTIAITMLAVIGCSTLCSIPGVSSLGVCSSPSASPSPTPGA